MSISLHFDKIPQIFSELNKLSHVELEYSSTLSSYQITTKTLNLVQQNIKKQIFNRSEELKFFTTDQGIGMRKIMLEHYERLLSIIIEEHQALDQITLNIYEKHRSMKTSLSLIELLIKEIKFKFEILQNQLNQMKEKIDILKKKSLKPAIQGFHLKNIQKSATKTNQEIIFEKNQENSLFISLFSLTKFEKLETKAQFDQTYQFLQIKLQQVEKFIKLQKEVTKRTIQKIFDIFDKIMGKGLQQLQMKLLNRIRKNKTQQFQFINSSIRSTEKIQLSSNNSSSVDLYCYETIQQIINDSLRFESTIKNIKKKLYNSVISQTISQTQSIEKRNQLQEDNGTQVSPTFNYICPMILESTQQINQFMIQSKTEKSMGSSENNVNNSEICFIYDSFGKENFNTINR